MGVTNAYKRALIAMPARVAAPVHRTLAAARRHALLARDAALPARRRARRLAAVIVAADMPAERVDAALKAEGLEPGRTLVLTDRDAFGSLLRSGLAVEYVPPRADLAAHLPELDYAAFLTRRIEGMLAGYDHERVLVIGEPESDLRSALDRFAPDADELSAP